LALKYPPRLGDILMCEFPACFAPPEMVKLRPVIVISRNAQNNLGLATVVPLSTTAPVPPQDHHCEIEARYLPPSLGAQVQSAWVKADMVYTLSVNRLSLVQGPRNRQTGKRQYEQVRLDLTRLTLVKRCVANALVITPETFM